MHTTALINCQQFFDIYAKAFQGEDVVVIEIGSQDVNGSIRACCPSHFYYCGVNFVEGNGVNIVLEDPYHLPFDDASVNIVLTNSCLEHSEMFWLIFLEAMRILKPHGILYINVPSNAEFHRYPVDCWRFYPDSGRALVSWARRNNMDPELLESFTSEQVGDVWNDYVAIFVKDKNQASRYPNRVLSGREDISNGLLLGSDIFINPKPSPEDKRMLYCIDRIINGELKLPDGDTKLGLIKKILNNQIKVR